MGVMAVRDNQENCTREDILWRARIPDTRSKLTPKSFGHSGNYG